MELINLLDSFALTQHIMGPTHQHSNTLDLVISTGLNIDNVSVNELPFSDHHCVLFDAEITFTRTKRELRVQKRLLDDKAEAKFSDLMRLFEPHSHDWPLSEMAENLNSALSSVLNTVAPLKVKKRLTNRISTWLNNNGVNEIKRNCQAAERK